MNIPDLKIAINCDWLTNRWWAEKVIIDLVKIFPNADIFTSIYERKNFPELIWKNVYTSYLQSLPLFLRKHTLLLPFYPKAFESFDFSSYDIVISSSHSLSKWIITNPSSTHICYCHTPVRALWSDHAMYKTDPRYKYIPNFVIKKILHKLRLFDFISSKRVDYFISNSNYIWKRIKKYYESDSKTIYPACTLNWLNEFKKEKPIYYLSISRLVPNKKNDVLIEAFNQMPNKKLKIYWYWSEEKRLKKLIKWDNIEIINWNWTKPWEISRNSIMSKAIAFIHPQKEDFWITTIEAQAFCIPVIAYWEWWALETIIDWKTWTIYTDPESKWIIQAVKKFEKTKFKTGDMKKNYERFWFERFKKEILEFIKEVMQ